MGNIARTLLPILLAGAATYLLLVVGIYFGQARFIYFPNVPGVNSPGLRPRTT